MVKEKVFIVSQVLNNPDDNGFHVYLVRDITSKPVCLCGNLAELHEFFEKEFGSFK